MALAVLATGPALAQDGADSASDGRGAYVSVRAGVAALSDVDLDYSDVGGTFGGAGPVDTLRTEAKTKSAFAIAGAVGYDFGMLRADVEVDYSRNKVSGLKLKSLNGTAITTISPADAADFCFYAEVDNCSVSGTTIKFSGGRVRQVSGLANLWLDIPAGAKVTPYVGGGIGVAGFETGGEGKARFAFQVGAGVAFNLSPTIAITGDYRFRQITGGTFTDDADPAYALRVGKLRTSTFSAGLRFGF